MLKQFATEGTLNERRVANAILYFKEERERVGKRLKIEDKETLLLNSLPNKFMYNDMSSAESRLNKGIKVGQVLKIYGLIVVSAFIIGLMF